MTRSLPAVLQALLAVRSERYLASDAVQSGPRRMHTYERCPWGCCRFDDDPPALRSLRWVVERERRSS
ncbi:hypothetical protein ACFRKB_38440 [Streptomyces scopuliridis]|uniref:hypothetical protein n=1 Tax=Streptomyces scopuliridis TaxID=452529 RepID=UPI0036817E35